MNPCPPVCAEHFNRRDGAPGCMSAATMRGPCLACGGTGTVAGGARCWPCAGTGELTRCRAHDFAAPQSSTRAVSVRRGADTRIRDVPAVPGSGHGSTAAPAGGGARRAGPDAVRRGARCPEGFPGRPRAAPPCAKALPGASLLWPAWPTSAERCRDARDRTSGTDRARPADAGIRCALRVPASVRARPGGERWQPYRRGPCGWLRRRERVTGRPCRIGGRMSHREAALHRRRGAGVPGAAARSGAADRGPDRRA